MPPLIARSGDELAGVIHDDVLQTLGVCLLEGELCRRFWRNGQEDRVVAELTEVMLGMEAALEASRPIVATLDGRTTKGEGQRTKLETARRAPARVRPLMLVRPGRPRTAGFEAGEILETLSVSLLQAELCRRLYQGGQERRALVELNTLLDRLERLVEMFRAVMNDLRESAAPRRVARAS